MSTIVSCPSCQRQLRVPENLLGRAVKCPSCGTAFTATESGLEESLAPAPSPPEEPGWEEVTDKTPPEEPFEEQYEEEPAPRRNLLPARSEDYEEEEDEERRPRRRRPRRGDERPGKVQAIAIMTLIGGILATLSSVAILGYIGLAGIVSMGLGLVCCLWPGPYYGLTLGIMAIIKGSALLGKNGHRETSPRTIAIMQIINIINLDIPNCVMGIISLVFLGDPEVKEFFREQ